MREVNVPSLSGVSLLEPTEGTLCQSLVKGVEGSIQCVGSDRHWLNAPWVDLRVLPPSERFTEFYKFPSGPRSRASEYACLDHCPTSSVERYSFWFMSPQPSRRSQVLRLNTINDRCSPPRKLLPFCTPDCHKVEVFSIASMPCSLRIPWNMPEGPQGNLTMHLAQVRGGLSQAQESFHLVPDGCQLLKVFKLALPTSSHTKDPAAIVIFL